MSETRLDTARGAAPAPNHADAEQRLRRSALALEGIFVSQLLRAMRETVPENQLTGGGAGEEIFTAMFDEHMAAEAPARWRHGMGESLFQQLRGAIPQTSADPEHPPTGRHHVP
jgi:flagellar protein FlgJ